MCQDRAKDRFVEKGVALIFDGSAPPLSITASDYTYRECRQNVDRTRNKLLEI